MLNLILPLGIPQQKVSIRIEDTDKDDTFRQQIYLISERMWQGFKRRGKEDRKYQGTGEDTGDCFRAFRKGKDPFSPWGKEQSSSYGCH